MQLDLVTQGFTYKNWGSTQHAKSGDWLVKNGDDTYTIDQKVFEKTYTDLRETSYKKTAYIWAEKATEAGSVKTKEGEAHYKAGDYIVSNNEDGSDRYCVTATKFHEMYEAV